MRLWSLHPSYLDTKGLLAVWREGLLAQHVLAGKTRGYKNHPQLLRFKQSSAPLKAINKYLRTIAAEAQLRGFSFDASKIGDCNTRAIIKVTSGQIHYETTHLLKKLKKRDTIHYRLLKNKKTWKTHPLFKKTLGTVESWEKTQ